MLHTMNQTIWTPHVTVAAIVERDGRYLIVEEEAEGRIVFNQPAGHLDPNETLQEAVIRETLEETGWHFVPEAVIGIYLISNPNNGRTYLRTSFYGQCSHHDATRPLDKEIRQVHWFTRDELIERSSQLRSAAVLKGIDDYLAGKRYPLEIISKLSA